MKLLIYSILITCYAFATSEQFICGSKSLFDSRRMELRIVSENSNFSLYAVTHADGFELAPQQRPVSGCDDMKLLEISPSELYLECNADGDAGFITLNFSNLSRRTLPYGSISYTNITGQFVFPEGNELFPEDTILNLECKKVKRD